MSIMLTKIGANEKIKNFFCDTRIPLYTVDNEMKAMLGKIILVNSVVNASFSGSEAKPGAIRIVNSFAKRKTMMLINNIIQNIKVNTLDEKYLAPLYFENDM